MSAAVTRTEWGRWAETASRGYWDHPEYEDILSECYLAAWKASERYASYPESRRRAVVQGAVRKAACEFLRSPRSIQRRHTRYGGTAPEWVPLAELPEASEPAGRDFAPALIEALAARG